MPAPAGAPRQHLKKPYFHGSFGFWPPSVADAYKDFIGMEESLGAGSKECLRALIRSNQRGRTLLSRMIRCEPDNLFFTNNATDAINQVFWALSAQDRLNSVVTTDSEFDSVYLLLNNYLRRNRGQVSRSDAVAVTNSRQSNVAIVPVSLWSECPPESILTQLPQAFAEVVSADTDIVILSDVVWTSGFRLPVPAIIEAVRRKNDKCFIFVDGAHIPGHLHVDLGHLGCDFYSMSAHKWLLAPPATGMLYIDRVLCEAKEVSFLDFNWHDFMCLPTRLRRSWQRSLYAGIEAYRDDKKWESFTELGSIDGAARYALPFAVAHMMNLKTDYASEILHHARFAKQYIASSGAFSLYRCPPRGFDSGITSFVYKGDAGKGDAARYAKVIQEARGRDIQIDLAGRSKLELLRPWMRTERVFEDVRTRFRLCTHYNSDPNDIRATIDCLADLCRQHIG